MMTTVWFSEPCTRLKAEIPDTSNLSYNEVHAKNIFEKYFVVDRSDEGGSGVNVSIYGGKDRITKEWLTTILRRGTSTDRVLALAFLVKSRPFSSLRHLDSLLTFISPAKKQTCIKAIEVVSNLLETILLPSKRALIAFENRPFDQLTKYPEALMENLSLKTGFAKGSSLSNGCREFVLAMWYFENQLKQFYFRFLTALENVLMSDTIQVEKTKALNALATLASKKPENRETAFSILVNKLGDRSKAFASNVIYKLRIMCQEHRSLKGDIVEQLRCLLFRPNLVERAKYYAIVLLSCIPLSKKAFKKTHVFPESADGGDAQIAAILFKVYLSFFRASVEADELPERLVTALLTGSSRVAPYLSEEVMSENVTDIDAIFRLVHVTKNFNISLQALFFLFHFTEHQPQLRDRYYQALYRKLNDQSIRWSSRGPLLLNLIYRSLDADSDHDRVAAIVQRLLSVCLDHPNAGFVAGTQILLEKLRVASKFSPHAVSTGNSSSAELKRPKRLLPTDIGIVTPANNTGDSDSDEEHFSDVAASEDDEKKNADEEKKKVVTTSWDHRHLLDGKSHQRGGATSSSKSNSRVRDPRFARALEQPCWQLALLVGHAHPTVAYFARQTMENRGFKYTGDPFEDLSVAHFLERFVYKKPKPANAPAVNSKVAMQPGRSAADTNKKRTHAKTLAPDSLAYKNLNSDQVPSDERFIHSYFNFIDSRHPKERRPGDEESGSDSDESAELDNEFDEYLRKHEKGLIPNDLDEDEDMDADFDYSTDEELDTVRKPSLSKKYQAGKPNPTVEEDDGIGYQDDENFVGKEDDEEDGSAEEESDDDEEISEDDDDDDDDEYFGPPPKGSKSGKFDLNKLFVSAEEVGDLYDNQEDPSASRGSKWRSKRMPSGGGGGKGAPSAKRKRHF